MSSKPSAWMWSFIHACPALARGCCDHSGNTSPPRPEQNIASELQGMSALQAAQRPIAGRTHRASVPTGAHVLEMVECDLAEQAIIRHTLLLLLLDGQDQVCMHAMPAHVPRPEAGLEAFVHPPRLVEEIIHAGLYLFS